MAGILTGNPMLDRKLAALRVVYSAERRYAQLRAASWVAIDAGDTECEERIDAIRLRALQRIERLRVRFEEVQ
jgi:hypothetical protein